MSFFPFLNIVCEFQIIISGDFVLIILLSFFETVFLVFLFYVAVPVFLCLFTFFLCVTFLFLRKIRPNTLPG